eukprot:6316957-Prymnesium_polylepis.2
MRAEVAVINRPNIPIRGVDETSHWDFRFYTMSFSAFGLVCCRSTRTAAVGMPPQHSDRRCRDAAAALEPPDAAATLSTVARRIRHEPLTMATILM